MRNVVVAAGLLLVAAGASAGTPALSHDGLAVRFDEQSRTVVVADRDAGVLLDGGVFTATVGGRRILSSDAQSSCRARRRKTAAGTELSLTFGGGVDVAFTIAGGPRLQCRLAAPAQGSAGFRARAAAGLRALPGILQDARDSDRGVLTTRLGPAAISAAPSLFDPKYDIALTAEPSGCASWEFGRTVDLVTAPITAAAPFTLRIHRHYYRDTLGIRYYAPMVKRPLWQTAPVVAMTWYGIEGWKGNPAQTKEWLYPQIDWVAKHLLPYAGTLVFQLDDNYAKNDDEYMRALSDYIRSKGLIPGIWFTPFMTAPKDAVTEHPDWFIHDAAGTPIGSFGGVSYGGTSTLNVTNPEAVRAWYGMWWEKASSTWNFDFFKIDGQPSVINAYTKAVDGGGVEGYRRGLQIGRTIAGSEKFINGCWGTPVEAIGLIDGSRTGGDTGNKAHAIDVILRWNFLNNVCWWSDPDAAANLYRASVRRARLNAQARVLTGQQFLTDDVWTRVPPAVRRVWQQSFPSLDIYPVNLYAIDDWSRYDCFDLRIAKAGRAWDVVGLCNYAGQAAVRSLDLGRLKLEAETVHVFEYWTSSYLGFYTRTATIERIMAPHGGDCLAIVPTRQDRPVLVSTSRHLTQGGLDLEHLAWEKTGTAWRVIGTSSHLVALDPYVLAFADGPWKVAKGSAANGHVAGGSRDGIQWATILPERSGSCDWTVTFEPRTQPAVAVLPAVCDLKPGVAGQLLLQSLGPAPVSWRLRSTDQCLAVTPTEGKLGPWPAQARLAITCTPDGLEPGTIWTGRVLVEAIGVSKEPLRATVRTLVPLPENLAQRAAASASSIWGGGYEARRVNDGDRSTRWNSSAGDTDGSWIELTWKEPVRFNRIVIDECTDFGKRVEAWRLTAGDATMTEIVRGTAVGRHYTAKLLNAVTAKRLRLTIEKASVVPTIWELEVYHWAPGGAGGSTEGDGS